MGVSEQRTACYGGSNYGDGAAATAEPGPWQDLPASLALNLPPLATLILRLDGSYNAA
jgi:1,4-alpha-glucan branching enzyme